MKKLKPTELAEDEYYLIGNKVNGMEPARYDSGTGNFKVIGTASQYELEPDEFVVKLDMPFGW